MLTFEIEKANAAYTAGSLVTCTDDNLPAPGLDLTFTQSHVPSIAARYTMGILGYGWTTNWDISASTDYTTGDATIAFNGATYFYASQAGGSFQSEPGDYSVLTLANGAYHLQETDGTVYQFNADGTLAYVEDSSGNRIVCGYDAQDQLVSLTDSNGEFLSLAYNIDGCLAQLTDSAGLTVTYAYNAAGDLLTSYTGVDGTTTFSYVAGQSAQQDNALAEVANADGTHTFFSYDSEGRLIDQHRDGGFNNETYTYLPAGGYTVTNALGDTTTSLFGLEGETAETIDGLGNVTHYYYDSNLNLTSVVDPGGGVFTYTYLCPCQLAGADFLRPVCRRGSQGTGRFNFAHSSMAA